MLDGEATLIVEGEERALKRWDYVHCERDVPHVLVGADKGALVLAVGGRVGGDGATIRWTPPRSSTARASRSRRAIRGRPMRGSTRSWRRHIRKGCCRSEPLARPERPRRPVVDAGPFGVYANFQPGEVFTELGFNVGMVQPGQPSALYHREAHQEGFLVLRGEALLDRRGRGAPLERWDYFHCPAGVEHIVVGAGDGPCVLLAVGSRVGPTVPGLSGERGRAEARGRRRAETTSAKEAYAPWPQPVETPFREEFVSG